MSHSHGAPYAQTTTAHPVSGGSPLQLLATQYLLKSFGFDQLTPAENAEQAIKLMTQAQTPFDIMLCDQCLPDLPGLELVEIASRAGFIRYAILLSGLPAVELENLRVQAIQRDVPLLGYLVKPLNKEQLGALISREVLGKTKKHHKAPVNLKHSDIEHVGH